VDLAFTAAQDTFRAEARAWLSANVPRELPSLDTEPGFAAHRDWERRMADERWSVVAWPEEYGGRGATLADWLIFEEEYWRAGAPARVSQNGVFLLAPTLFAYGTDEQRRRFLPRMAGADDVWAQAWSEPGAGSDLAALRSTATRDEAAGGWRLSGQKTWSSRAVWANWAFGLFRSDPASDVGPSGRPGGKQRHRGLTYFLFPLNADGVTVRPIRQLDGETGFAEIFLDDVVVPDDQVLGSVNEGWAVAMATTSSERGLSLRSPGRFIATADRLLALAGEPRSDDVVDAWCDAEAYRLYTWAAATRLMDGDELGAASSLMKVFWSEMDVRMQETALRLLGDGAPLQSSWLDGFLFALSGPIYAGTNEIQRDLIAERVLNLPRSR
jgi:alkylation response protein AidB-like acyl-CoA dehydrogenase